MGALPDPAAAQVPGGTASCDPCGGLATRYPPHTSSHLLPACSQEHLLQQAQLCVRRARRQRPAALRRLPPSLHLHLQPGEYRGADAAPLWVWVGLWGLAPTPSTAGSPRVASGGAWPAAVPRPVFCCTLRRTSAAPVPPQRGWLRGLGPSRRPPTTPHPSPTPAPTPVPRALCAARRTAASSASSRRSSRCAALRRSAAATSCATRAPPAASASQTPAPGRHPAPWPPPCAPSTGPLPRSAAQLRSG